MEITYKTHSIEPVFNRVQISYQDLMYASQNMTPTSFRIYLYIIGHPNKEVTRDDIIKYFHCENKTLWTARQEMIKIGAGSIDGDTFTCYNTIWGENKQYVPEWV